MVRHIRKTWQFLCNEMVDFCRPMQSQISLLVAAIQPMHANNTFMICVHPKWYMLCLRLENYHVISTYVTWPAS